MNKYQRKHTIKYIKQHIYNKLFKQYTNSCPKWYTDFIPFIVTTNQSKYIYGRNEYFNTFIKPYLINLLNTDDFNNLGHQTATNKIIPYINMLMQHHGVSVKPNF